MLDTNKQPAILEIKFKPTESQLKTILSVTDNPNFPWFVVYQNEKKLGEAQEFYFSHGLRSRYETEEPVEGYVNSSICKDFEDIFLQICADNGVKVNTILRSNLNLTTHIPKKFGWVHTDHEFEHKNFILYLNDFSNGPTHIFDDDGDLIKEVSACKYKAVIFDGLKHAQGYCDPAQFRIVLVVTFV